MSCTPIAGARAQTWPCWCAACASAWAPTSYSASAPRPPCLPWAVKPSATAPWPWWPPSFSVRPSARTMSSARPWSGSPIQPGTQQPSAPSWLPPWPARRKPGRISPPSRPIHWPSGWSSSWASSFPAKPQHRAAPGPSPCNKQVRASPKKPAARPRQPAQPCKASCWRPMRCALLRAPRPLPSSCTSSSAAQARCSSRWKPLTSAMSPWRPSAMLQGAGMKACCSTMPISAAIAARSISPYGAHNNTPAPSCPGKSTIPAQKTARARTLACFAHCRTRNWRS